MNLVLRTKVSPGGGDNSRSIAVKSSIPTTAGGNTNKISLNGEKSDRKLKITQHNDDSAIHTLPLGGNRIDIQAQTSTAGNRVLAISRAQDGETSGQPTRQTAVPKESLSTARARRNIIKTLILVAIGFVVCWSWSQLYFFITNLGLVTPNYAGAYYRFSVIMVFINTCINPVIYCAQYKLFQQGCKFVFCRNIVLPAGKSRTSRTVDPITITSSVVK